MSERDDVEHHKHRLQAISDRLKDQVALRSADANRLQEEREYRAQADWQEKKRVMAKAQEQARVPLAEVSSARVEVAEPSQDQR